MNRALRSLTHGTAAALVALSLTVPMAEARVGSGSSSGSRGMRTQSAPAPTATAPRGAQPMQRTETNAGPSAAAGSLAGAAQPRRFGFGSGLMAGLLGAGVLGMLMGHGFLGGLSGLLSVLGFALQVALFGGLIWLAIRFFRRRSEPALAGAAGTSYGRSALGGDFGATGAGGSARPSPGAPVEISPADYSAFERALTEIQAAYGREDLNAITYLATPEMVRYFGSDLEANRSRGLRNHVADAKLLQGDLAEAWREGTTEYATLAMRFSAIDAMVERSSGKPVSGDMNRAVEATELWTFRRDAGGRWTLSAIQQSA